MNIYKVTHLVRRTRTVVETAEVTSMVEAGSFGDAGDQAEELQFLSLDNQNFVVENESSVSDCALASVSLVRASAPAAAMLDSGLPPAVYDAEPAPDGRAYNFIQVEPVPSGF
jgi:hypothetical protein